jgi:hypothetical protein
VADGTSNKAVWRNGAAGAILAIAVIAVAAGAAYVMGWRVTQQTMAASCVADGAIDATTSKALDQAALDFVATVSGNNPIGAYAMLAADTKGAITPDKFLAALRPSLEPVAPFSEVHIAHAYFVRLPAGGANQRVICGNLDQPDHWVAVSAKPIPEQAHLIVDATAQHGHWAFVLWLVPENGWHIEGFNFTATGMAGKSLADIVGMARDQHAQHHDFNAVLLYGAAAHLASRGGDLQLGIEPDIEDQIAKLPIPGFLKGKPPLNWKIADNTYKIDNIGAAGVGDKIYLAITQELSPWHSDADADTRNRTLIQDFARAIPEYSAAFSGLILLARDESGSHLYRTVATNQAEAKPADAKPAPAKPATK